MLMRRANLQLRKALSRDPSLTCLCRQHGAPSLDSYEMLHTHKCDDLMGSTLVVRLKLPIWRLAAACWHPACWRFNTCSLQPCLRQCVP